MVTIIRQRFLSKKYENKISKYFKIFRLNIPISLLLLITNSLFAQPLTENQDKFLGGSTGYEIYRYFEDYWNQMTPGNAGKWGSVEPVQGQYNWTYLDQIYNFCQSRNILFKEHVLVWGSQQPGWIGSLDSSEQREAVENWMEQIGTRYPKMDLVDVVNEPFHSQPSYKNALGGNGETGWDWIITSFELARQYMPDSSILILNEYNVLHDNEVTDDYIEIIELLKNRNLIDGIGIQGHYFEFRSAVSDPDNSYKYNINTIKSNLNRLGETSIPIYITEFDIDEPNDQDQLEQYQIYFSIFWTSPYVKGITFWGYIEGDVWNAHPDTYILYQDRTERPALTWLRNFIKMPFTPELISPSINDTTLLTPKFIWSESNFAESYSLQVSRYRSFSPLEIDTIITDTSFTADSLVSNTRYYWKVNASNEFGSSDYSSFSYFTTGTPVSVQDNILIPDEIKLYQNYPNPFNPTTTIEFILFKESEVYIAVYDQIGRMVDEVISNYYKPGKHKIMYDGTNLPSGVYYYQMKANGFMKTRKFVVLK